MIPVGSIIKLKPEFEERYIILHQYTFPQVLQRIRNSNIRNYSIFLREGTLFSYYEYRGNNLKSDLDAIARDPHTQNWWKLTDPMQEPFEFRSPDEWWTEIENIFQFENKDAGEILQRVSLWGELPENIQIKDEEIHETLQNFNSTIGKLLLYKVRNMRFIYAEVNSSFGEENLIEKLNHTQGSWGTSKEVFHTD